jgi:hypothetical protein
MYDIINPDNIKPGRKASLNNNVIEVEVVNPYIIKTIDGGIIVPKDPDAQTTPIAKS